ncbi:DUF3016 domain-containing protein [Bradyrhizobium liaoningense]|uniref:DUF3016 domain-containing protein n=1 Tax=Bradyrhizobium liaoningense TaxID=43992 RepID=UPI001BA9C60C|nr:DUF3016 domain-containing protein [Bradyrhizobium liaoningense]MBR0716775.1 DUF3016 domain-containing protein [Bradyrhizobium liaoningense]
MIRRCLIAATVMAVLFGSSPGFAGVKVRFVNPERYTDAESSGGGRAGTLAEFRGYLEALGNRYLAPGQAMSIDVLDIDLAGQLEPRGHGTEVRVMRDVTPPRIRLHYTLSGKGGGTRSGDDVLSDISYQSGGRSPIGQLSYEKALLNDWFRRVAGTQ